MPNKLLTLFSSFRLPLFVFSGIILGGFSLILNQAIFATIIFLFVIIIGSIDLVKETITSLMRRRFALDYIALLAITVSIIDQQFLVGAVIVLMLTGGQALEAYAMQKARRSLTALIDRIPNQVTLAANGQPSDTKAIESIEVGEEIFIRKGEVIPLDGILISAAALTDESSLTGEPYTIDKLQGDHVRSGTINIGEPMLIRVTKTDRDSTYRKIIKMVQQAQEAKAPLLRLADRYSTIFTIITLIIAAFAYLLSGDLGRILAVLVIATPCPLILATPIALIGGMNAAARQRIILKDLAAIEALSRVDTIVFDKTGTLTIGKPIVRKIELLEQNENLERLLGISASIERNSLHPLAKAILVYTREQKIPSINATNVHEEIGHGITGYVDNERYTLAKHSDDQGMAIQLLRDELPLLYFFFSDELKAESQAITNRLSKQGIDLHVYTGDKKQAATEILERLQIQATLQAEMKPEDKQNGIANLKEQGKTVAMVGDGINDAPALARADVGMVFSNEEHTAASEAADIVFLGGEFDAVTTILNISRRTIHIALQSIIVGIGLSVIGMLFAAFGLIPPVYGAFAQEAIDILVILNALRAAK